MAATATISTTIKPMLARQRRHPFDSPEYLFEFKWDGLGAVALIDGEDLLLQSRNLRNLTSHFPELSEMPRLLHDSRAVLDGELGTVLRFTLAHPHAHTIIAVTEIPRRSRGRCLATCLPRPRAALTLSV